MAPSKDDLMAIQVEALVLAPGLARAATAEIKHESGDDHELWYRGPERSCRIAYYADEPAPRLFFFWDGCEMFRGQTREAKAISSLLQRWLCDLQPPSRMKAEFPGITLSPVTRYYEEGRPIEGEFICSWDSAGHFYREIAQGRSWVQGMLDLISEIRKAGHDRTIRAGQSMFTLILSRSRRHGLRPEQPFVAVGVDEKGMTIAAQFDQKERLTSGQVGLSPELVRLLKRLESEPIA